MSKKDKEPVSNQDNAPAEEVTDNIEVTVNNNDETNSDLSQALLIAETERKRADELTDICQRLQADFDNYRKRNVEMNKRIREDAIGETIEKFLPVLDVLDHALAMIKDKNVVSGLEMLRKQVMTIFEENGVKEIEAVNTEFDPNYHNAVMCVEDNENSGKVIEVLQKGYIRGDKVLRHCAVKIAK